MKDSSTDCFYKGFLPHEWVFLSQLAAELGFCAAGVARAGKISQEHADRYDDFLNLGYNADMSYLSKHRDERFDLRRQGIVEAADVVVVFALPFGVGTTNSGFWSQVASYARGTDYHQTVRNKLEAISEAIGKKFPASNRRIFVDTAPVMERTWAQNAGVGVLGRNGMILVPGVGPRVVLGEIVCAGVPIVESIRSTEPFSLCGDCSMCIDACPTGALVSPAVVDARSCLSYWTIENRSDEIPKKLADTVELLFGCDRCIAACPQDNLEIPSALDPPKSGLETAVSVDDLSDLEDPALKALIKNTPLERTGPRALKRNAALIQGKKLPRSK